jgi:hypothetical protein
MQRVGAKFAARPQPLAGILAPRGLRWSPASLWPRVRITSRVTVFAAAVGFSTSMRGAAH